MAAKRTRNSSGPSDTQSRAKKIKHDTPKPAETAETMAHMGVTTSGESKGSTPEGMPHKSWGDKVMNFYPSAIIEAVAAFAAGAGATSAPVISAASSSSIYVVTCLIPGEHIKSIQHYATVGQANKRAMTEFADKCHFLAEATDESWRRGRGWPGKPCSAMCDIDLDGCWIAVGQNNSAEDCTTVTVAKRSPRDRSPINDVAADRREDDAIDAWLRPWLTEICTYISDEDAEDKLTDEGSLEDE